MGEHRFNPVVKWLKEHGGFAKLSLSERKSMRKAAKAKWCKPDDRAQYEGNEVKNAL